MILGNFLSKIIILTMAIFNHREILSSFYSLFDENSTKDEFKKLADIYEEDLDCNSSVLEEFKLWQRKIKTLENKPKNSIEALVMCNKNIYLSIYKLFQILGTLPISSATNERTYSTLKKIKTYLRNTISEVNKLI